MPSITPAQIRGARGMLDWSMNDLAAAARLSISSIKRIEDKGQAQVVSNSARDAVRAALEDAGAVFTGDPISGFGVALRP